MHLYDSTYTRLKTAYDNNFDAGAGKPLLAKEQELTWTEFARYLPSDGAPLHGLVVEYGLSNDSLRFGMSYVQLNSTADPDSFVFTPATAIYGLSSGLLKSVAAATWRLKYQYKVGTPTGYFGHVRVRHTSGGSFAPVSYTSDPHSVSFPWETELKELHDQNDGHADSTLYVVLRAIARTDAKGAIMQSVAFNMRLRANADPTGAYRDLLNNSRNAISMLAMHACDFGSLCPADCTEYVSVPQ